MIFAFSLVDWWSVYKWSRNYQYWCSCDNTACLLITRVHLIDVQAGSSCLVGFQESPGYNHPSPGRTELNETSWRGRGIMITCRTRSSSHLASHCQTYHRQATTIFGIKPTLPAIFAWKHIGMHRLDSHSKIKQFNYSSKLQEYFSGFPRQEQGWQKS